MTHIALLIIALSGGVLVFDYVKLLKKRAEDYVALALFYEAVYNEIDLLHAPPSAIEKKLSQNGDARIRNCAALISSPERIFDFSIEKHDAEMIFEYFGELGTGSAKSECERASSVLAELNRKRKEESGRLDAKIMTCRLLYGSAIVCALILAA